MDIFMEWLGGVAAVLTTVAFFPQVLKVWKTRSTADISLVMFAMLCIGIVLWEIYGVYHHSWPLMIGNGVTLIQALIILGFKLRYG